MKPLLTTIVLAAALPACAAQEKARPNTLTPQEIADGWLLLFDGETTFGWRVDGEARAEHGLLVLGGGKATTATMEFGYFEASWELRWDGPGEPRRVLTAFRGAQSDGEAATPFSHARVWGKVLWTAERWRVRPDPDPQVTVSSTAEVTGSIPGGTALESTFGFRAGRRIVVRLEVPAGTRLYLRNVKLKPEGLKPLCNGKDLAGWKEPSGKKSRFTVTRNGELNVRGGPGELQTEGEYDDFVLRLDGISNGDGLGGVFFRGIAGEARSGFEVRLGDQGGDNDRSKPGEGTGGIRGFPPARKVVLGDKEWFTLTVIARGNRLAAWVNGYQTADVTDDRPAGKGGRRETGPIALRGTDLSFRNIRIAELPQAPK
jgi:hypothetical protein